jgi:hypothetical protein
MISETAVRDYVINNAVDRHNMSRELAEWVFDSVGQDVAENWSQERYMRWVNYSESVYGFTTQHHKIINQLTLEYTRFVKIATAN